MSTGYKIAKKNGLYYSNTFVQAPANAQPACRSISGGRNYNRYSYCLNNPLMYTDPSGYNYLRDGGNVRLETEDFDWSWGEQNWSTWIGGYSGDNKWVAYWDAVMSRNLMPTITNSLAYSPSTTAVSLNSLIENLYCEAVTSYANILSTMFAASPGVGGYDPGITLFNIGGIPVLIPNMVIPQSQGDGDFSYADELKKHFQTGNGEPYHLSWQQLNEIFNTCVEHDAIMWGSKKPLGNDIYSVPIDLYKTTLDLGLAFGRATLYVQICPEGVTATGFYDYWDLDSKDWGTRPYSAEILTRYFNSNLTGTNFKITFP